MKPVNAAGAAEMLGRSRAWFYDHLDELAQRGFPAPLPVCGRWDPVAIGDWKARQSTIGQAVQTHAANSAIDEAFGL